MERDSGIRSCLGSVGAWRDMAAVARRWGRLAEQRLSRCTLSSIDAPEGGVCVDRWCKVVHVPQECRQHASRDALGHEMPRGHCISCEVLAYLLVYAEAKLQESMAGLGVGGRKRACELSRCHEGSR